MFDEHSANTVAQHPKLLAGATLQLPKQGSQQQSEWSPYMDNGGTTAAIAGKDFVIVAGDRRLNGDFCLYTRHDESKIFQLTENTFLASNGMQADRLQLQEMLKYRIKWYSYNNGGKTPSTQAISQLLSTILYQRRFFPYYTFNMIIGFDKGEGVCYSYDVFGSTEPLKYGSCGTASTFVQPLLDCLLMRKHFNMQVPPELSMEETLSLLRNAFISAAERDIYTGDSVCFIILTKDAIRSELFELRRD